MADGLATGSTPVELGFSMPPEWAEHEATWLAWPRDPDTWIAGLEPAEDAFVQMVEALVPGERVELIVEDEAMAEPVAARLSRRGLDVARSPYHAGPGGSALGDAPSADPPDRDLVRLHVADHVDSWVRDYGPTFLTHPRTGELAAVDWTFDAWGGKYEALAADDRLGRFIAEVHGARRFRVDAVMEGGSIEVDGAGTLLTTEACLLEADRNPGATRSDVEALLASHVGVDRVIWLPGRLAGDDTDGHVDTLARFADPGTVLVAAEDDPADANHGPLAATRKHLEAVDAPDGGGLEIVELPMPSPVVHGGQRFAASYANLYLGNDAVLVPTFDDPADEQALARIEGAFPGRRIVPIDGRPLIVGFGACHCLTQQVPVQP